MKNTPITLAESTARAIAALAHLPFMPINAGNISEMLSVVGPSTGADVVFAFEHLAEHPDRFASYRAFLEEKAKRNMTTRQWLDAHLFAASKCQSEYADWPV